MKGTTPMNDSASIIEAFPLARSDKNGTSEGLLICESPVCNVDFEQSGIARLEPRRFCDSKCRQNAWIIRQAAKLLKQLSDEKLIQIMRASQ